MIRLTNDNLLNSSTYAHEMHWRANGTGNDGDTDERITINEPDDGTLTSDQMRLEDDADEASSCPKRGIRSLNSSNNVHKETVLKEPEVEHFR